MNSTFWGIPGLSLSSSEYVQNTFSQIQNIEAPKIKGNFPYNRITREQLRKSYEVSPTLKELEPSIEAELAKRIIRQGGKDTSIEVSVDWIHWSIVESVESRSIKDSVNPYQIFTTINYELKQAFDTGRLKKKNFSFESLDLKFWFLRSINSLGKTINHLVFPKINVQFLRNIDDPRITTDIKQIFDRVALRRTNLIGDENANRQLIVWLNRTKNIIYILNIIGIVSIIFVFIWYFRFDERSSLFTRYITILVFLISLIAARVILYTAIDMAFFPIFPRYLFTAMPLLSALSILNSYIAIKIILFGKGKLSTTL